MIIGIASADYQRADRSADGSENWGGAGWARIGQYVKHYELAGHQVVCGVLWKHNGHLLIEDCHKQKIEPDVILIQRIMHEGVDEAIRMGQANGQLIINDLDDWYWGLDPSNQAFAASHPKHNKDENTNNYSKNVAASDILTVSTPYLAERMRNRVNCPIVVVPNYVDVERFTPVEHSDSDSPLVGWVGSIGHRSRDLETISGVLRPRIVSGDIRMHHSGHSESAPSFSSMIGVEEGMVTTLPMSSYRDYPSLLKFDVGLVPLRDTPFNRAKSEIKGLEYAASGIPFIAQDLDSYRQLHNDWGGAFWLARRPQDWIKGLNYYRDFDNRVAAADKLKKLVKTRDIKIGAETWLNLITQNMPD